MFLQRDHISYLTAYFHGERGDSGERRHSNDFPARVGGQKKFVDKMYPRFSLMSTSVGGLNVH